MKVKGILTRELYINGNLSEISGLKLIRFTDAIEVSDSFLGEELHLSTPPEIVSYGGLEIPFTITTDLLKLYF